MDLKFFYEDGLSVPKCTPTPVTSVIGVPQNRKTDYKFIQTLEPTGYWALSKTPNAGTTHLFTYDVPNKFHRLMHRLLLGWVWVPASKR